MPEHTADAAALSALPIGMFDSGIGGLTVLHECLVALPAEDFVYFGDTARFPYGSKTQSELKRFAGQIAAFLEHHGVKLLVVACYSATAAALPDLQERFSTPIVGVVMPGARAAVQSSRYRRIGVLATEATVASGSYVRAIASLDTGAEVYQQACPGLASFIEEGDVASRQVTDAVRRFTEPLKKERPDVVIMGCTHYPLVAPMLQRHLGRDVKLVNPAAEIAREVERDPRAPGHRPHRRPRGPVPLLLHRRGGVVPHRRRALPANAHRGCPPRESGGARGPGRR